MKKIKITILTSFVFFLFTFSLFSDSFKVVSWNMWVLSQKIENDQSKAKRKAAIETVLKNLKHDILIAQEILDDQGATFVSNAMPSRTGGWNKALCGGVGSRSQGNAIWYDNGKFEEVLKDCHKSKVQHPVVLLALKEKKTKNIFVVVSVHFIYASGKTEKSKDELLYLIGPVISDFINNNNIQSDKILIGGDTNMPTESGSKLSARNMAVTIDSGIDQHNNQSPKPALQYESVMDQPTSRSPKRYGGQPRNNYDHFILSDGLKNICSNDSLEQNLIEDAEKDAQGNRDKDAYTSDHFPISITCDFNWIVSSPAASPATAAPSSSVSPAATPPAVSPSSSGSTAPAVQGKKGTKRKRPDSNTQ